MFLQWTITQLMEGVKIWHGRREISEEKIARWFHVRSFSTEKPGTGNHKWRPGEEVNERLWLLSVRSGGTQSSHILYQYFTSELQPQPS